MRAARFRFFFPVPTMATTTAVQFPTTLPITATSSITDFQARPHTMPRRLELSDLLDLTESRLLAGDAHTAISELRDGLWWHRQWAAASGTAWNEIVDACLAHPVRELIHQDPFTYRAFSKPRGYAGDAPLIDMMYFDQGLADLRGTSSIGRGVFRTATDTPAPRAVRERRTHLAHLIDRTAMQVANPALLAVACGHFREGWLSSAVAADAVPTLIAADQDLDSLDEVRRCYGRRVTAMPWSVKDILGGCCHGHRFDLIYAAGLYDYLNVRLARRLTAVLFELLNPGGQLVVANFTQDVVDVGYMETFMGWNLIFRDLDELASLSAEIPDATIATQSVYALTHRDIAYLRMVRAAE